MGSQTCEASDSALNAPTQFLRTPPSQTQKLRESDPFPGLRVGHVAESGWREGCRDVF
jgi:hypothetical protein